MMTETCDPFGAHANVWLRTRFVSYLASCAVLLAIWIGLAIDMGFSNGCGERGDPPGRWGCW